MEGIRYWIETEGTGHWYFLAFPVILLCLFIRFKGRRVRFLIPSLLISLVIINPWFYRAWDNLGLYAYWRILWVVPVIPIIAAVVPSLTEKVRKGWIKALVAVTGVGLVVLGGTFLYNGAGGSFVEAANAAKVPDYVARISDRLLEIDDHPRVVAQYPIGVYMRQYTGDIDTLYGRNIDGYIVRSNSEAQEVNSNVNGSDGDLQFVSQTMLNNDYRYLILDDVGREDQLKDAQFELIDKVAGYGIYQTTGNPTVIKERNELGQVVKSTIVDETGIPINGSDGYSTILYDYDREGNVIREFRVDTVGQGVADRNGYAGYERGYDSHGYVTMQRMLDADSEVYKFIAGYSEYRREFKKGNITKESYFDEKGVPVNRIDTLYHSVVYEYDEENNRISERYYDINGNPTESVFGYAIVLRKYDQGRLLEERYYSDNDEPTMNQFGYAVLVQKFDERGYLVSISICDENDELINGINGYAVELLERDERGNICCRTYLDDKSNPVVTANGYAEVRSVYDEDNRLIYEEYIGADNKRILQAAGHSAIRQEWAEDGSITRYYLNDEDAQVERIDGYSEVLWITDECGNQKLYKLLDVEGEELAFKDINLVDGVSGGTDGWSEWMTPTSNTENAGFTIGTYNLGSANEGDSFVCQLDVEFKGVRETDGLPFGFTSQGSADRRWDIGNIWNKIIDIRDVPEDGVYHFEVRKAINEKMTEVGTFTIEFRCDNWLSGSFRVKNVKIEYGETATSWTPGF